MATARKTGEAFDPAVSADEVGSPTTVVKFLVIRPSGVSVAETEDGLPRLFGQGETLSVGAAALHSTMLLRAGFVTPVKG